MRAWLLCPLFLTGCFAPEFHDGNSLCGPSEECPPGFNCSADQRCYRHGEEPDLSMAPDLADAATDMTKVDLALPEGDLAVRKNNGEPCGSGGACGSGLCIDGVCCETTCDGQCQACDVSGMAGKCVQVPSGQPHGARSPCASDGTACGGACGSKPTACDYPGSTISCRAQSCASSVKTLSASCDGKGACPLVQTSSCGAFHCSGPTECYTSCTGNGQCVAPAVCISGVCKGQLPNGSACPGGNGECQSGFCVDGYCCDSGCTGQCEACNITPGVCVQASGAPKGSRPACGGTGMPCGGMCGTKRNGCDYPITSCRTQSCAGGIVTQPASCDGAGACPSVQTTSCSLFACNAAACHSSCTTDAQCTTGNFCNAPTCKTTKPNGRTCSSGVECTSTFCVDGYCCDVACNGQCEACDLAGSLGTCKQVGGAPHGTRSACTGTGTTCGGTCSSSRTACTYPPTSTLCNKTCKSSTTETAFHCSGNGSCSTAGIDATCANHLVCSSNMCLASCSQNGDCQSGYACVASACVPMCSDGIRDGFETDVDCGGSQCAACPVNKRCNGNLDCTTGSCVATYCALVSDLPKWLTLQNMPDTRSGHGGATGPNGKVYVWSGAYTSIGQLNLSGESYTTSTATWSGSLAYVTTPRYDFGMVAGPDRRLYAIGGYTPSIVASVEAYNTANDSWLSPAPPSMNVARRALAVANGGGRIYAFGGLDSADMPLDVIESYTPGAASWTQLATKLPQKLGHARAVTGSDGRIYISGGYNGSTSANTLLVFDPATNTFLPSGGPMSTPRSTHTFVAAPDGRLYAISSTVEAYTGSVNQWQPAAAPTFGRSRASASVGGDGRIYLCGGDVGAVSPSAYVEAYGPVITLSAAGAPRGTMASVSGSNFARSAAISVYFDSQTSTAVATATTDGAGVLAATAFTVPVALSPGIHTLIVVDARSQYPAFTSFNVQ